MRTAHDDAEILKSLSWLKKYQVPAEDAVTAVLTTAAEIDDVTLDFDKAGFAEGDYVLVDSGLQQMVYVLGPIPVDGAPIPINRPVDLAHALGASVKKLVELDMGYIEEGSATFGGSSSVQSVGAANASGTIFNSDPEVGPTTVSWLQRATSLENIAAAYGIDELTGIRGNGDEDDPKRLLVHPTTMAKQVDYAYILCGVQKNLKSCKLLLLNPVPNVNIGTAFGAKNNPATWSVGCTFTHKLAWVE